ncbi:protein kinase family protein [Streptomyces cellulosae]|uniref:Protein kinase family protein n=1 Tax=Streptomyces cellulosae TaxID=1968 RepID=A0ABW7XV81_STRCE
MPRHPRVARHTDIATALSLLSDRELADLVASGTPNGQGVGGRSTLIEVGGVRVFVKRVPLTDTERLPEHVRSTANLFGLPPFFHYGIGLVASPGLGAWRELAAHTMTTNWVLSDRFSGFPLLHHWRVLPDIPHPLPHELADVERAVAYWGGTPQVRERIEGRRTASANLALFLEYIPHTVHDWLETRLEAGAADTAVPFVEQGLEAVVSFLHTHELLHLDAHFKNILTDGHRLYLTDYGLSLSAHYRLTPEERDFVGQHRHYDRAYTRSYLVVWLVTALYGYRGQERDAFVRGCADGERPDGIPEAAADVIARHAREAVVMGEFNRRFQEESRLTPYPPPSPHAP